MEALLLGPDLEDIQLDPTFWDDFDLGLLIKEEKALATNDNADNNGEAVLEDSSSMAHVVIKSELEASIEKSFTTLFPHLSSSSGTDFSSASVVKAETGNESVSALTEGSGPSSSSTSSDLSGLHIWEEPVAPERKPSLSSLSNDPSSTGFANDGETWAPCAPDQLQQQQLLVLPSTGENGICSGQLTSVPINVHLTQQLQNVPLAEANNAPNISQPNPKPELQYAVPLLLYFNVPAEPGNPVVPIPTPLTAPTPTTTQQQVDQVDPSKIQVVVRNKKRLLSVIEANSGISRGRGRDRKFQLKPFVPKQPKRVVPTDGKTNDYWEKRAKNNQAAKKSRDLRRVKENEYILHVVSLEEQYAQLQMDYEQELDKKNRREAAAIPGQNEGHSNGGALNGAEAEEITNGTDATVAVAVSDTTTTAAGMENITPIPAPESTAGQEPPEAMEVATFYYYPAGFQV